MDRPTTRVSRPMPFGRRLAITITSVAILPLVAFGLFAITRVDASVAAANEDRVRDALAAVDTVLARRQGDLAATAGAYASWSVTADLAARDQLGLLREDLLGFIEARGDVDMAVAVIDGRPLTTGTDPDAERLAAVPADAATSGLLATDRGLVQVAVAPIGADGSGDRLVFGDRLDSDFALEVRRLTGFDLAILDRAGSVSVASDPDAAAAVGPTIGSTDGVSRDGSLAAGWMRPPSASGSVIVVTAREDEVQSLLGPLPVVLVVMLVVGALLAVLVALVVGRDLNTRLATIHRGLIDVAAGRRPEPAAVAGGPDVDRLTGALDGLVSAMDRRDRILREASQTVAGWDPGEGEAAVARAAAAGAVRIFGLRGSTVTASGGRVLASTGDGAMGPGDRRVEAPLEMSADDPGWLIGQAPADPSWTDADDALLGMYASLVGAALQDARVHEERSDRLERLGRVNDLQVEFLRSVSHNLQTPLTTISLVADDLADPGARTTPEFRARQVHAIQVQSRRLERMVAQLITVSRLDAGRQQLERDAVAIAPLARRVWAALDADRPLDVTEDAGELIALGDRDAIEQILWILLDNAMRYAPTGPIRVATVAEPLADGPGLRIEVHDAGPGVPEDERRHIFQRFWSGSAGRAGGGTGIGLDIARRLARAMAGTLRYEAGRPVGATFVLTLPADVARPD